VAKRTLSTRDWILIGGFLLILLLGAVWLTSNSPSRSINPEPIEINAVASNLKESDAEGYDTPAKTDPAAPPPPPEVLSPIPPLPQHPQIKVYFNQSRAAVYTDPYRNIERYGDNLEQLIVDQINKAQYTLDLSVHELNLPLIAQAIVRKHQSGVKVRLIMENTYTQDVGTMTTADIAALDANLQGRVEEQRRYIDINADGKLSPDELGQRDSIYMFNQANVPWIDDTEDGTKGTGIMHNKYILVDDNILVTGSTNQTYSDVHGDRDAPATRGNTNNLVVITSPELVKLYREDFRQMWGDGPGGNKDSRFGRQKTFSPYQTVQVGKTSVGVQFSPAGSKIPFEQTTNGTIINTINRATSSVHLALFVFSSQEIVDALLKLETTNPSVNLGGVFDRNFSYRDFSETLDMWGVSLPNRFCKIEPGNQPWPTPQLKAIVVPALPEGDKMHHKYMVVDGRIVLTGSHNWSLAANNNNDENTLVIEDATVAAHYEREYKRLFERSIAGPSTKLKAKIAEAPTRCPDLGTSGTDQPSSPTATAPAAAPININTADAATLEKLPGISAKTAQAIVEYRQTNGPFRSIQDLDPIKGIGPKTLEKLAGQVTF